MWILPKSNQKQIYALGKIQIINGFNLNSVSIHCRELILSLYLQSRKESEKDLLEKFTRAWTTALNRYILMTFDTSPDCPKDWRMGSQSHDTSVYVTTNQNPSDSKSCRIKV